MRKVGRISIKTCLLALWIVQTGFAATFQGNPSNYLDLLDTLEPGDTLLLEPGIYDDPNRAPGLPLFGLHGEPDKPITIAGPETGPHSIFLGRSTHNTVRFDNASYIIIKNIEINGRDLGGDGINAQGVSHHITLDNILIRGVGENQQTVGISTKATAWNWIIRRTTIMGAGTGMYLGNSDGSAPFINGIIEHNLVTDTFGYNIEIKHQNSRPTLPEIPENGKTIIRHNVFSKGSNSSTGSASRPNLLVGHFPLLGPGMDDVYLIYGNFFYQNPTEALFQGEGNLALHHNLFVNSHGDAVNIQPHNDVPRAIHVFNNTVVAAGAGIRVRGGNASHPQKVIGNVSFASTPIQAADQKDNITDAYGGAGNYLVLPFGSLGEMDLYPKEGKLKGTTIDPGSLQSFLDWNRDFNGDPLNGIFRGAYTGEGENHGWKPKLEIKPSSGIENAAPSPPKRLTVK